MKMAKDWPIYVLSLDGETERRAPLLSTLSELGYSAEILIGVDGRCGLPEWAEDKVERKRRNPTDRPLTDGELACALSHLRAYQRIMEEDLPGAIIFEDDARLDENFGPFMKAKGYSLGDMILLGHGSCYTNWSSKCIPGTGVRLHRIAAIPVLAHAYSVSRSAAQTLVSAATPVREIADWPCDISKMSVFAADPQLAWQNKQDIAHSHLQADRMAREVQEALDRPQKRHRRIARKRVSLSWWSKWFAKRFKRRLS